MSAPRLSLGIRARTTLVATIIVGVAMAVGVAALIFLMAHALRASLETAAVTRASDVAIIAKSGSLPAFLPGRGDALLVQVVSDGKVISSSRDLANQAPLVDLTPLPDATATRELSELPDLETSPTADIDVAPRTRFLVIARGVQTPHGRLTVLVAASLSPLQNVTGVLVPFMVAATPAALLAVALATWLLTGAALGPVSAVRRRAEAISGSASGERLPVPAAADEVRELVETMNHMLDRIDASRLAQKRFVSDASHELKSPIAAMRTMIDVARSAPSVIDIPSLLDDLAAEDSRLELLVADLLLLATSDEGSGLSLDRRPVRIATLAAQEVALLTNQAPFPIELEATCAPSIEADSARLRQLLRNLLDNAVRHAASGVWVELRCEADVVVIAVSDDGPGIPPETRERVFERFFRIDESRGRSDGGTGLGLAVCQAITQAHGGTIRATDSLRGGATLEVRLPSSPPT